MNNDSSSFINYTDPTKPLDFTQKVSESLIK